MVMGCLSSDKTSFLFTKNLRKNICHIMGQAPHTLGVVTCAFLSFPQKSSNQFVESDFKCLTLQKKVQKENSQQSKRMLTQLNGLHS